MEMQDFKAINATRDCHLLDFGEHKIVGRLIMWLKKQCKMLKHVIKPAIFMIKNHKHEK